MVVAKDRCENGNNKAYKNYGGRGIEFRFVDTRAATIWVLDNLGLPPTGTSIDRIDNNGHYEAGNLRWATSKEQSDNKREYLRRLVGNRVAALQRAGSPYSYEAIRCFILKDHLSDAQILVKTKNPCGRKPTTWKHNR
jgi:hypothetical protein